MWRKSSYSGSNPNGDCVEVAVGPDRIAVRDSKNVSGSTLAFPTTGWRTFLADAEPAAARWRKSSYSGSDANSDCVEVAVGPDLVGVRDSKNVSGSALAFPTAGWRAFLTSPQAALRN